MNQNNQQEEIMSVDNNNNNNNNSNSSSNSFLIYSILMMIIIFIIIEGLELGSSINFLIKAVSVSNALNTSRYFNQCIKYPMLFKMCYTVYSLSASLSSAGLLLFLMTDLSVFLQKFAYAFIQFNYFMFGPLLCGLTSSALIYYNKTMIICNNNLKYNGDIANAQLSFGLLANTISFLIISVMIILIFEAYESINYTVDSILNKPNTSGIINYLFWRSINEGENNSQRG